MKSCGHTGTKSTKSTNQNTSNDQLIVQDTSSLYTHFTCFNTKNVNFFYILVHNNEHIMTLKYDKFKCYWAAVTEKNIK